MGVMASAPVELVRVQRGGERWWKAAVAEMQGWRPEHEDSHFMRVASKQQPKPDATAKKTDNFAVFGVLDGHGGAEAARLAAHDFLPEKLRAAFDGSTARNLEPRVARAFIETDVWLRDRPEVIQDSSGSTCVVAGVRPRGGGEKGSREYDCFVANAGDSRGVVIQRNRNNVVKKKKAGYEVTATDDHKPDREDEHERISAAGGYVSDAGANGVHAVARLDGSLAVSRGLGDFQYKRDPMTPPEVQKVSCIPELYEFKEDNRLFDGDVLILACDGIFDVMSNDELAKTVVEALDARHPNGQAKHDIGEIAASITFQCLHQLQSKDNMTLMIIMIGEDGRGYCYDDGNPGGYHCKRSRKQLEHASDHSSDDASTTEDESSEGGHDAHSVTDQIVGLEKYAQQTDDGVKRSYVGFLEYCERYTESGLPRAARAILTRNGNPGRRAPQQKITASSKADLAPPAPARNIDDLVAFVEGIASQDEPTEPPESPTLKKKKKNKKKKKKNNNKASPPTTPPCGEEDDA